MTQRVLTYWNHDDIFAALDPNVPTGLYIVQSLRHSNCYRVGAGGVDGETSLLTKRINQHRSPVPSWDDTDWTQYHRRWQLIWAVQFVRVERNVGKLCEALLIGRLASQYYFIPEAGESGFCAAPEEAPHIAALARSVEPEFDPVINRQDAAPSRQVWRKGDKFGVKSSYLGSLG